MDPAQVPRAALHPVKTSKILLLHRKRLLYPKHCTIEREQPFSRLSAKQQMRLYCLNNQEKSNQIKKRTAMSILYKPSSHNFFPRFFILLLAIFMLSTQEGMCQIGINFVRELALKQRLQSIDKQIEQQTDTLAIMALQAQREAAQKELNEIEALSQADTIARRAPDFTQTPPDENTASINKETKDIARESTESDNSGDFDYEHDARLIRHYIKQKNSLAAANHLKEAVNPEMPTDASLLFDYSVLAQEVFNGLTNEGYTAAFSMDLGAAFQLQMASNEIDLLHTALLVLATAKGEQRAAQILQLKTAMRGNNTVNTPQSGTNENQTPQSIIKQETCSLCHGKGWIAGSKSPTYGNTGTHWCQECGQNVLWSHSHDLCPSCRGKGTILNF